MSRVESDTLPPPLRRLLDGERLEEKVGETILLITVSASGWPHVAMLSVGEIVSRAPDGATLALWQGTETGENLRREGRATLVFVAGGAGHYVEVSVTPAGTVQPGSGTLDRFECRVERALSDEVGYARLTSGITFDLPDEADVVARWKETIAAVD